MNDPAIFLMGPTASGKTELAVRLVEALPLAIVSVDSALVYKGLDIGAARPDAATLARAPHRLIGLVEPEEIYSAARFREDARAAMAEIRAEGRTPLLVGGTMLYFRALEHGLSPLPPADAGVRAALDAEAAERGWPALHAELARVDPEAARRIHPNDPQRLQRALEVYRLTGRPISAGQRRDTQETLPWRLLKLAIAPADRAVLHARIEARFQAMLAAGLVADLTVTHGAPSPPRASSPAASSPGSGPTRRCAGSMPSIRAVSNGFARSWRGFSAVRKSFRRVKLPMRIRGISATFFT